jgi:hypothetical protein
MAQILAFWRVPYSASTARRLGFAVLAPLLAVAALVLAAAGRADTAASHQRNLAARLVGRPASQPPVRPRGRRVVLASAVLLGVGVACWLLLWRFTYAVLPLPLAANFLAIAVAGRAPAVARSARRLAGRLARRPADWTTARVLAVSAATLLIGAVGWALLAYLVVFAAGSLAFPFMDYVGQAPSYGGPPLPWDLLAHSRLSYHDTMWASTYANSNGGPTLAGAWTYHAAQFLVTFAPLFAWAIRGLTRAQAWLTQALLGAAASGRPPTDRGPAGHTTAPRGATSTAATPRP